MSSETSTTLCNICSSRPKARFRCNECQQNLCEVCLTFHQKFNGTNHHEVCQIATLNSLDASTECPIHSRRLEFHCSDDGMDCCSVCKDTCHKMCKTVIPFPDIIQEKHTITKKCNQIIQDAEQKRQEAAHCHKLLKQNTDNWLKRINKHLQKMRKAMEDLDDKVKQKEENLQVLVSRRQTETDKLLQAYSNTIQDLGSKLNKLKAASLMNSEAGLVKAIKEMEEAVRLHEGVLDKDPCEGHTIALLKEEHRFEAEHYVTRTLEEMLEAATAINNTYIEIQRNSLHVEPPVITDTDKSGVERRKDPCKCCRNTTSVRQMKTLSDSSIPRESSAVFSNENQTDVKRPHSSSECAGSTSTTGAPRKRTLSEREKFEHYQSLVPKKETDSVPEISVESAEEINIRMPEDNSKCAITGIAELSDGYIIMADFNNFKLKLMNRDCVFIDSKQTHKEPRDIAVIDGHNVMVSIPMAQSILFVEIYKNNQSTEHQMKLGKTYNVDGKCCGIAYHDGKIYTATQVPTQILILSLEGEKLHSIGGENLFERPTYTTVAPDGSLIYMSDPNHKYVYGLNQSGNILFKYKVDGPHGIATTENGDLLVADFDSSSVHLVSSSEGGSEGVGEGVKMAALAPENCHCPQKVYYNSKTRLLLVTMWNSDTLFQFKLKLPLVNP